ncbi:tryptophan halogenase family protein [Ferrimonas marina]|uniref:Tryptophan halogenase n=1 Tax=Ferrimonas marina TaxID=299255 RepID=A0A1M5YD02_9GAMM|nr:tryptophan halogenase family protein [Ferrimonas marina]SHI09779.1 tryptophan halogenase [Ferrimonas marina]
MTGNGQIREIVIVGGGTAGWLAACHMARKHGDSGLRVTLVESPDIATIGVGEGTVPAMRQTLHYLGIRETDFIRRCDATLKQGIRFVDWRHAPNGTQRHHYYHPFDYPAIDGIDPTPYWLLSGQPGRYADAVGVQAQLCDAGLGPKTLVDAEFTGPAAYAYHLDAAKFAALLTEHATERLGVVHRKAEVLQVELGQNGQIAALHCSDGKLKGDLFVDCTGFAGRLIEGSLNVPWRDRSDTLFVDTALAIQVPYDDPEAPIACQTISTAMPAGWIWDIGLTGRRGIGHVYASSYIHCDQAEQQLRDYIGPAADGLDCRRIPMKVGYREQAWKGNCVAIGLSGGFVEPLEATGILLFDLLSRMLAEQLPGHQDELGAVANRFNRRVNHTWERVIDFIKLHYAVSERDDSAFWRDNRDPQSWSQTLQENLAHWRHALPSRYDFASTMEVFNLENYLYVLYGMGYDTQLLAERFPHAEQARQRAEAIARRHSQLKSQLLGHRQLISRIQQHGLQKV